MLLELVLIGVSMLAKDCFYVGAEFLISRERALWASAMDIVGDIAAILTYGVGGVLGWHALQHGHWLVLLGVLVAVSIGSFAGTVGGLRIGQWFNRHFAGLSPAPSLVGETLARRTPRPSPSPLSPPPLSPEDKSLLRKIGPDNISLFARRQCEDCGGIHAFVCPRLRSVSTAGGGREATYWAWGEWPTEGIIWPEAIFTPDADAETTS